jgi:hypothetical protein
MQDDDQRLQDTELRKVTSRGMSNSARCDDNMCSHPHVASVGAFVTTPLLKLAIGRAPEERRAAPTSQLTVSRQLVRKWSA